MLPSSELELEMILMKLFWTTQEDVPEFLYKQSFILIKRRTFKKLISILFGTLQRELQSSVVYYIYVSFGCLILSSFGSSALCTQHC